MDCRRREPLPAAYSDAQTVQAKAATTTTQRGPGQRLRYQCVRRQIGVPAKVSNFEQTRCRPKWCNRSTKMEILGGQSATRGSRSAIPSDHHHRITSVGWSYRSNQQGWIIYREPQTGLWHTRSEALGIVERGRAQD
jgi:hypothetical protein